MIAYSILTNFLAFVVFMVALRKRMTVSEAETFEERVQILQECSFYVVTGWILIYLANF